MAEDRKIARTSSLTAEKGYTEEALGEILRKLLEGQGSASAQEQRAGQSKAANATCRSEQLARRR